MRHKLHLNIGINMLVELDSRQEIKVPTGKPGKVFQNFLILLCFYFVLKINWQCSLPINSGTNISMKNSSGTELECGS